MTALTAAARKYDVQVASARGRGVNDSWQSEAWSFYQTTPEVRFAAQYIAQALSAVRLFAGIRQPDNTIVPAPDDHPASLLVEQIAGGPAGQAGFLQAFGPQLTVAGESWIVICPVLDPVTNVASDYAWHVLSTEEIRKEGKGLKAEINGVDMIIPPYDEENPDDTAPLAIRVWEPAPWRALEADSVVRSAMGILEELQLLTAAVAATARSRITGRGILVIPKGARFPTPGNVVGDSEDDFIQVLIESASTAIKEPGSASANVPLVVEVPQDVADAVRLISFASEFDTLAIQLREECIRRFANAAEIPAEILLGLADRSNHWSAALITAEAVKTGIEPKAARICNALTESWLQPLLETQGVQDAADCLVWYDTSELRAASNRSVTALEAYKLGLINARAARRESGFDEADAPGGTNPDSAAPADVESAPVVLPVAETGGTPDEPLLAALEATVYAALSRAGDRILNRPVCPRSERTTARAILPAARYLTYRLEAPEIAAWGLLEGAWDRVPVLAERYGLDAALLRADLTDYTTALLTSQVAPDEGDMRRLVARLRLAGRAGRAVEEVAA